MEPVRDFVLSNIQNLSNMKPAKDYVQVVATFQGLEVSQYRRLLRLFC